MTGPGAPIEAGSITPVAVLGTLAEFHRQPLPYDLAALVRLVGDLAPDLLCLDLTAEQWQRRDFGGLPREYRAALLPLAEQTDIVVVPLAAARPPAEPAATGPRGGAIRALRRLLVWLQRQSPGAAAADGGARHWLADLLYVGIAALAGRASRRAWSAHTGHLSAQILAVARRDPGRRILVVVSVRHCHHIRRALRRAAGVRLVPFRRL